MKFGFVVGLVAALAIGGVSLLQPSPVSAQDAAPPAAVAAQDYRLGVSDKVRILVYNEPTLSGEFSVNSNGSIAVPLIGDVAAVGKTTSEITTDIQTRLSDGYLRDPKVSIDVITFRPFYILGEVNKPGEYPYSQGLTVLNAVATAQGFTYRANKGQAFIKKAGDTKEIRERLRSDLAVSPGDTIRIGERYF